MLYSERERSPINTKVPRGAAVGDGSTTRRSIDDMKKGAGNSARVDSAGAPYLHLDREREAVGSDTENMKPEPSSTFHLSL